MSRKILMMAGTIGLLFSAFAVLAPPVSAHYDHPTYCYVSKNYAGPPQRQDVTVTDADGIKRIYNKHIINGTISGPHYNATHTRAVLTATKANQHKRTFWEFDVEDKLGHKRHCV